MKFRSIALLMLAEVAAMSLWFVSAAVLPDMLREVALSHARQAALSSGVQAGFVIGALGSAVLRPCRPLRSAPRVRIRGDRGCAGQCRAADRAARRPYGDCCAHRHRRAARRRLSGRHEDRGRLGREGPRLPGRRAGRRRHARLGGAASVGADRRRDWRVSVAAASIIAGVGGLLVLASALGPHHVLAARFDPRAIAAAWSDRPVRLAYAGYLGHMWELYAMWAWIAVACAISYGATLAAPQAEALAKLTAFLSIAAGGVMCIVAGSLPTASAKRKWRPSPWSQAALARF